MFKSDELKSITLLPSVSIHCSQGYSTFITLQVGFIASLKNEHKHEIVSQVRCSGTLYKFRLRHSSSVCHATALLWADIVMLLRLNRYLTFVPNNIAGAHRSGMHGAPRCMLLR